MGKHSDKDVSSSSKKLKSHHLHHKHHHSSLSNSNSKSQDSSSSSHHHHNHEPSWVDLYAKDNQTHEHVAMGMPSGRGDTAAYMTKWDAQWAAANSQK
ncbi:hypothetical protein PG995_003122 [Apiospora arundinis]